MRVVLSIALVVGALLAPRAAYCQAPIRPEIAPGTGAAEQVLRHVGVDELYESAVPLDATFRDHAGNQVRLADLWRSERPALLQFVYYSCATTCDAALTGLAGTLGQEPWTVGTEYDVYTISMDPRDTPRAAEEARERILGRYGRAEAETGWHFLVGDEAEIARVAAAVGYRFYWDEVSQQFAHPGVLIVLRAGEQPRPGRYLHGLEHQVNDVRLGLAEAAEGRTLSPVEHALLYCFRYDAHEGRYVVVAWNVMRVGGGLTALAIMTALVTFWRREIRNRRVQAALPQ